MESSCIMAKKIHSKIYLSEIYMSALLDVIIVHASIALKYIASVNSI